MERYVDHPPRGGRAGRRLLPGWRLVLGLGAATVLLAVIAFSVVYARVSVPGPNQLVTAQASVVYFSDAKTEIGRFSEVNRQSISLAQVPQSAQHAVLAAEDRTFYTNAGVSPRGMARAVWVRLRGGSTQGGSTITQQYVKNYFLTQDRTYTRKIKEFVIALKIEQRESKAQILQNYLNTIYFGRGAYGIETASQAYFGHPAAKLTVGEGALLAAVIRSPGLYDPVSQRARAQQRVDYVLDAMVSRGWLPAAARATVTYPRVRARTGVNTRGGTNGYLLLAVQDELKARVGLSEAQIDQGGLRVVSTFDRVAQKAAVEAVAAELPTQNAKGVRVGLAAIAPGDGAVIAMYGGPDQVAQPLNAATQSVLQAGSTFKPFALAAALEDGKSLRSRYSGRNDQTFPGVREPVSNFGNESFGRISLITATEDSVNTAFVALNVDLGPAKTRDAAVAAGLSKATVGLEPNISNVLGTASPRVIDMADAYATFAAQGLHAPAYVVRTATSATTGVHYRVAVKPVRAFAAGPMADLTYALQRVTRSGSGSYAGSNLDRPVAGKTGTSSSNRSAWFVGYTPQLAAAVGIYRGGAGGSAASLKGLGGRSEVTGGSFPVRIWTAFVKAALRDARVEQFPDPVYGGSSGGGSAGSAGSPGSGTTTTSTPYPSRSSYSTQTPSATQIPSETQTSYPTTPPSTSQPPSSTSSPAGPTSRSGAVGGQSRTTDPTSSPSSASAPRPTTVDPTTGAATAPPSAAATGAGVGAR